MKTLKSFAIRQCYTAVVILTITACRTKHLNKQMTRTSDRQAQETTIKNKQNELYQGNRIISMIDSGNHQYRVNIFPLDTFSFSLHDGFKGRASVIEIIGTAHQVRQIRDSSSFIAKQQNETQYDLKSKSRETAVSRVKSLEKSKSSIIPVLLGIGLAGLIVWVGWRFWKMKIRLWSD